MILKLLEKKHNRKAFTCGVIELDNYIRQYVSQDIKRKLAVCYVMEDERFNVIAYYTLSSGSVKLNDIPDEIKPAFRYTEVPVVIIGRLAVHEEYQGHKFGLVLLIDAFKRIVEISTSIGSHAVIVDPINDAAERFYAKFGFISLRNSKRMFITLKTIIDLFNE